MIVITGAAGFIGSCVLEKFNRENINNVVIVDDFSSRQKEPNYSLKTFYQKIDRRQFPEWLDQHGDIVTQVIHIGARTDTTEFNVELFNELNLHYTMQLWSLCARHKIPF